MFLGCDLSLTSSGLVVIDDNYNIVKSALLSTPFTGVERLAYLRDRLKEFLLEYQIKQASIEGGAYHEIGRIYQIGQWAGIVHLFLFDNSINFIEVAPLQVKKYVSGKGNKTTKQLVILDVYKNFKEEIRDDNLADAYVLSRIAHDYFYYLNNQSVDLTEYRKEIILKLYKSYNKHSLL